MPFMFSFQGLNGTMIKGRNIKVEKSESKGPRKPSTKLFVGNLAEGTTPAQLKVNSFYSLRN